jgi:hypothetical protein
MERTVDWDTALDAPEEMDYEVLVDEAGTYHC